LALSDGKRTHTTSDVARALAPGGADDPAKYLRDEADRIYAHLRRFGNSHTIAIFVTPDGVFFASVEGRRLYRNLVAKYGHLEIGHYNRRVDLTDLRMDVMHAAREIGLV